MADISEYAILKAQSHGYASMVGNQIKQTPAWQRVVNALDDLRNARGRVDDLVDRLVGPVPEKATASSVIPTAESNGVFDELDQAAREISRLSNQIAEQADRALSRL